MGSIKVLSSKNLLIYNSWENKKDGLLVIAIFLLITIIGMIYAYVTQGWIQNLFFIWISLLIIALLYILFSIESIVFNFEENLWLIVKRVFFYPVRRHSGKISNIAALVSVELIDDKSLWTRIISSDRVTYCVTLELKTFAQDALKYNYYPIISKRSINQNSHKNNLMLFAIIGKAVIDIFSQLSLPLDYEVTNQNDIESASSRSQNASTPSHLD